MADNAATVAVLPEPEASALAEVVPGLAVPPSAALGSLDEETAARSPCRALCPSRRGRGTAALPDRGR